MANNITSITQVIAYIENHLEEPLNLERIAKEVGYSKYHLHRMFRNIVGFTPPSYIQRRRLTEASRLLTFTKQSIMEIAIFAGYETQQSFSVAFKAMFGYRPQVARKKKQFHPLQRTFTVDGKKQLRRDMMMDITTVQHGKILLVGYRVNTNRGSSVIGKCMRQLLSHQKRITQRLDPTCIIGLNDYTEECTTDDAQPFFTFYAAAEVSDFSTVPKKMITKELPPSTYVVFTFREKPQDSMQPVADYIYKEWFPQSTCPFHEKNRYDFTKSFASVDSKGNSIITYWVPIL